LKGYISDDKIKDFINLIENNEISLGIETILEQICEDNIVIPSIVYNIFKKFEENGYVDKSFLDGVLHTKR
jgi:Fe2+ or Zn2+ uptake regulation protein